MAVDVSQFGEKAQSAFDSFCAQAKDYIEDPEKMEKLLQEFEKTSKDIPGIGNYLSDIATMASMARSYALNEYREISTTTIASVVGALLYVVVPNDIIPDNIPVAGLADDAGIIVLVCNVAHDDIEKYRTWREENDKVVAE